MSVPNEYNLRRHFETNHRNLAKLNVNEKSLKAKTLRADLRSEQNLFELLGRKVLPEPKLVSKFQEKLLLQEKLSLRENSSKTAC